MEFLVAGLSWVLASLGTPTAAIGISSLVLLNSSSDPHGLITTLDPELSSHAVIVFPDSPQWADLTVRWSPQTNTPIYVGVVGVAEEVNVQATINIPSVDWKQNKGEHYTKVRDV